LVKTPVVDEVDRHLGRDVDEPHAVERVVSVGMGAERRIGLRAV
jgi:hypothetical protein